MTDRVTDHRLRLFKTPYQRRRYARERRARNSVGSRCVNENDAGTHGLATDGCRCHACHETYRGTAVTDDELLMDVIPIGWGWVRTGDFLEITAPGVGFVTVDLARRCYRAGLMKVGDPQHQGTYTARGWRRRLVEDAIAWLMAKWPGAKHDRS